MIIPDDLYLQEVIRQILKETGIHTPKDMYSILETYKKSAWSCFYNAEDPVVVITIDKETDHEC